MQLAYLPDRKREYIIDDDAGSSASELSVEGRDDVTNLDELVKDYKRNRRRGMFGWFKLRKPENLAGLSPSADSGSSASGSPASCSKSLQDKVTFTDMKDGRRKSVSRRGDDPKIIDSFPERTQAGDLFSEIVGGRLPPIGTTISDQTDLLQEQMKMLAGEVALSISSLKRLSEKAASSPEDSQLREQMRKLKDEINEKRHQIRVLEQRMIGSVEKTPHTSNRAEMSQALSKFTRQLNEKTFELEIKSADNRILQEQLQLKISENAEMQEIILLLRQQLNTKSSRNPLESADNEVTSGKTCSEEFLESNDGKNGIGSCEDTYGDDNTPTSVMSLNRVFSREDSKGCDKCTSLNSQILVQASEIESLKQEKVKLTEEKDGLEIHCELAAAKDARCRSNCCQRAALHDFKQNNMSGARPEVCHRKQDEGILIEELQKELNMRNQGEAALEAALSEREQVESDFRRRINEAKRREENLENELANMWMLVAKMRKPGVNDEDISSNISQIVARNGPLSSNGHSFKLFKEEETRENLHGTKTYEELRACYQEERRRSEELERLVSRMKGEDISDLDVTTLEELQNFHVEAIAKICHAKCAIYML
ncbi:hypothetical protein REPUB_Repub19eG0102400 [Reevesia pubescens]